MLLEKESIITKEFFNEYKDALMEIEKIDKEVEKKITFEKNTIFLSLSSVLIPGTILILLLEIGYISKDFERLIILSLMLGGIISMSFWFMYANNIEKIFYINNKLMLSKGLKWLQRKLIFRTNKNEKKYIKLMEQKEILLSKFTDFNFNIKVLEDLFEKQKSELDMSSTDAIHYVNAYNCYRDNMKNNNKVEAIKAFINYFENKDLKDKSLANYI